MTVIGVSLQDLRGTGSKDAIRTVRAAAGRRSGKTAGPRTRDRRGRNRRSCSFSQRGFRARRTPARATKTRQKLEPLASVGITYRCPEEAEAEGPPEDVQHELLLCGIICGGQTDGGLLLPGREVPSGA